MEFAVANDAAALFTKLLALAAAEEEGFDAATDTKAPSRDIFSVRPRSGVVNLFPPPPPPAEGGVSTTTGEGWWKGRRSMERSKSGNTKRN